MNFKFTFLDVLPSHLGDYPRKKTWGSLPVEAKRKIIQYVPLKSRFTIKPVCRQWFYIIEDLNRLQTKLIVVHEDTHFTIHHQTNSLCNLASHNFDHTSKICLPTSVDGRKVVKNFPGLLVVSFSDEHARMAAIFAKECRSLEHFSYTGHPPVDIQEISPKLSCLGLHRDVLLPSRSFPSLKFFDGSDDGSRDLVGRSAKIGPRRLKGHTPEDRIHLTKPYATNVEVLYDVELENVFLLKTLCEMPKLTTIYACGDADSLASLDKLTGLTNLSWIHDDGWTEEELYAALKPWGHRLQSLSIDVYLDRGPLMKAVVDSCPNLEELHIPTWDPQDPEPNRNPVLEFKLLKQLRKLTKLSVDGIDVDMAFLNMFDPEIPAMNALGGLLRQMTIKQLIYLQYEITKPKSALEMRILELESQLAMSHSVP